MSVSLRAQRDGQTFRKHWYGEYREADGKRKVVNLNVEWKGTPPSSGKLRDAGDQTFERSRERAIAALKDYQDDARRKGRAESLTERLIESKTGRAVEYSRIADLSDRWRMMGRDTKPSVRYLAACDAQFRRFNEFMATRNPTATYLYEVTEADAAAFVEACRSVLAPGTARDTVQLVSTAFTRFLPVGGANPFDSMMGRRGNSQSGTIHRKPFSPDELRTLLEVAQDDDFMYPLVVCATMTGMRRGDVCRLRWTDVDLPGGMLAVNTAKTDSAAEIPIFPMLRDVLIAAGGKGSGYVWPKAAEMLKDNPDGLTWRFKKMVAQAFANDMEEQAIVTAADMLDEGLSVILEKVSDPTRRERMIDTMTRYAQGRSVRVIEKETGIARATISNDLRTVEAWTGRRFVRSGAGKTSIKASVAKLTRVERKEGRRAASVWDWHCLRVTWITLALAAGVPMELVRRVTGHATVDIVLKHYFRPDREHFRAALSNALPEVLTGKNAAQHSEADELIELALKAKAGTATKADKKTLRLLAAKV